MATRMQQRRGTAAEWTSADPVLAAGEIGYETDTGRFKFGDGATAWSSIDYFSSAGDLIDGAPAALDTLNELAAALNDDENFAATVTTALGNRVLLRVDTADNWANSAASDPIDAYALVIEADTGKAKVNGNDDTVVFADLDYLATEVYVDGAIAAAIPATVDSTEIGYLNGVTSSIQDQINTLSGELDTAEADISTAQADIVTNSGDISTLQSSVATAQTDITNLQSAVTGNDTDIATLQTDKANLDSPTFQGTVVLPATTSIGNVDGTEIGYLDGVTSGIQAQIDGKLGTTTATATYAPLSGPTFTGTVSLPSTTSIGNVDATELGYLDGVTSSVQTQLDAKADLASPTFTGTVSGIDKTMVGLGNVDNTADADKPVSTATQTALDLKANLAGATFTGDVTVDTNLVVEGDFTVNGTNFSASATSITIEDNIVQLAHQNSANTVDLGLVVAYNDGASGHAGIVRDVSDDTWKLFKGVATEPATTVAFTEGSLDDLALNNLTAAGVVFTDGTQTKAGVPSLTEFAEKTASYTLDTLAHQDNIVEMNSASATTFTIPTDAALAWPVGASMDIFQTGAGQVTISGDTGVTVNYTPGNKLRTQWSSATILKRASNSWVIYGDLTA